MSGTRSPFSQAHACYVSVGWDPVGNISLITLIISSFRMSFERLSPNVSRYEEIISTVDITDTLTLTEQVEAVKLFSFLEAIHCWDESNHKFQIYKHFSQERLT